MLVYHLIKINHKELMFSLDKIMVLFGDDWLKMFNDQPNTLGILNFKLSQSEENHSTSNGHLHMVLFTMFITFVIFISHNNHVTF